MPSRGDGQTRRGDKFIRSRNQFLIVYEMTRLHRGRETTESVGRLFTFENEQGMGLN